MHVIALLIAATFSQPEPTDKGIVRNCQCECCVVREKNKAAKIARRNKAKASKDDYLRGIQADVILREFGYSGISGRVSD